VAPRFARPGLPVAPWRGGAMLSSMGPTPVRLAAACALLCGAAGCPVYVVVDVEDDACSDVACGAYAYCDAGACVCEAGYVPDDFDPAACVAVQKVLVEDGCDDGRDIAFRLWSSDGSWVWPGGDDVFWTVGYGLVTVAEIACEEGTTVCFGAEADGLSWGVGLDGTASCAACCFDCFAGTVDLGVLACDAGPIAPSPVAHDENGSVRAANSVITAVIGAPSGRLRTGSR